MRYEFIQKYRDEYPLSSLCRALGVSRSGYYRFCHASCSPRSRENERRLQAIRTEFVRHKRRYGSPRITLALHAQGWKCNEKRVARLMHEDRLRARRARRFVVTTDSNHPEPCAPNLLQRAFAPGSSQRVWLSDITYIRCKQQWAYLAVVLDLNSRRVLGWSLSKNIDQQLTIDALHKAINNRRPGKNLIFHSDRGVQYAGGLFRRELQDAHITQSMSRKGNCWDNAPMESFFATLKIECVHGRTFSSIKELRSVLFEYIEAYYNTVRLHSTLEGYSPDQFERAIRVA